MTMLEARIKLRAAEKASETAIKEWRAAAAAINRKIGDFPESVSLGGKAMGWVEAEIDNWIASRMAARQRTPAASTASR